MLWAENNIQLIIWAVYIFNTALCIGMLVHAVKCWKEWQYTKHCLAYLNGQYKEERLEEKYGKYRSEEAVTVLKMALRREAVTCVLIVIGSLYIAMFTPELASVVVQIIKGWHG